VSTTARRYFLKGLRSLGVKNFRAKSGLGLPYICHVGDFAGEVPFYYRQHSAEEIVLMASWCRSFDEPVIFDVGANNGFIATQLAQLLKGKRARIFAFEPIPSTFAQLKSSVEKLSLQDSIIPICCALSDSAGITSMAYNPRESLFAQVRDGGVNSRVGKETALAATLTVDEVVSSIGLRPILVKIDVEGYEPRVLRGAKRLLLQEDPPAICFEWNPVTLAEAKTSSTQLLESLSNYNLYYVDDFEGGKELFGKEIRLLDISWVCNVFAVPAGASDRWSFTVTGAQKAITGVQ